MLHRVQLRTLFVPGEIAALARCHDIPWLVGSAVLARLHVLCGTAKRLRGRKRKSMLFREPVRILDRQPHRHSAVETAPALHSEGLGAIANYRVAHPGTVGR